MLTFCLLVFYQPVFSPVVPCHCAREPSRADPCELLCHFDELVLEFIQITKQSTLGSRVPSWDENKGRIPF